MGRLKRGNYLFYTWIGDHGHHVHVFKDDEMILKWDLDDHKILEAKPEKITKRLWKILFRLIEEGRL